MAWISKTCPNCKAVNQADDTANKDILICSQCGDTIYLQQEENLGIISFWGKYWFYFVVAFLMYYSSKWYSLISLPYAIMNKGEISGNESCGCFAFLFLGVSLAANFGENAFIGAVITMSLWLLSSKSSEISVQAKPDSTKQIGSTTSTSSYKKTNSSSRLEAINWALDILNNADNCLILDTETTGLRETDEVIEIGIIDMNGNTVFHSYVKPLRRRSIPAASARIHGITMAKLKDAPTMIDIHPQIRNLLKGRIVIAYNSSFDRRLLKQTFNKYDLTSLSKVVWQDAMVPYSKFVGSSRWIKTKHFYLRGNSAK